MSQLVEILVVVAALFFATWTLLFIIANYLVLQLWRKGYDKPLFALAGPIASVVGMLIYFREINWLIFWTVAVVDPGGVLAVILMIKYIVYDRHQNKDDPE